MSRQIPSERWAVFTTVAAASKNETVLVACRSAAVRRQYERAISKLGGKLENVIFHIFSDERTPS